MSFTAEFMRILTDDIIDWRFLVGFISGMLLTTYLVTLADRERQKDGDN